MPSSSKSGAQCTCFCRLSPAGAPIATLDLREPNRTQAPKYTAQWRSQLFANGSLSTLRITDLRRCDGRRARQPPRRSPSPRTAAADVEIVGRRSPARGQRARVSRPRRGAVRRAALAHRAAVPRRADADSRRAAGVRLLRAGDRAGARRSPRTCWHARFTIAAGEPVRIRTLDVGPHGRGGARPAVRSRRSREAGLASRRRARSRRVRAAQAPLGRTSARERGYADAQFTANRIDVYPDEHAADIALHFDSGVALRVRPHRAHARRADGGSSRRRT